MATKGSKAFDDPGVFVEIPLVNQIRPRVKAWREAGLATPPVMTTVCNRTETAARVKHAFNQSSLTTAHESQTGTVANSFSELSHRHRCQWPRLCRALLPPGRGRQPRGHRALPPPVEATRHPG